MDYGTAVVIMSMITNIALIVSLMIVSMRTRQATETVDFLRAEVDRLSRECEQLNVDKMRLLANEWLNTAAKAGGGDE